MALPGDPGWYDIVRDLQQNEAALAQVRAAARLDGLGFVAEPADGAGGGDQVENGATTHGRGAICERSSPRRRA